MENSNSKNGLLSSGQLARLTGVSSDTLRHYERKGVLLRPRRGSNGYRTYPPEAVERVQLIRRALSVGFTLDELARIMKVRDSGGAPCEEVRNLAAEKLSNLELQLQALTTLRDELRVTLKRWDARLASRSKDERVGLLESLSGSDQDTRLRTHLKRRITKEKKR